MLDTNAAVGVIAGDTSVKTSREMRDMLDRYLSTNWAMVTNCIDGRDDFIITIGSSADAGGHYQNFRKQFCAAPLCAAP